MSVKREEIGDPHPIRGRILGAAALMFGGPAAFLVALSVRYSLVTLSCDGAGARVLLEASTLVALIGAIVVLWRGRRMLDAAAPGEVADQHEQPRFIATFAMLSGVLFLLAAVALWLPSLFLSPCGL